MQKPGRLQVTRERAFQAAQQALEAGEQYAQPGPCTLAPVFRDFAQAAGQPAGELPADTTGHGPCRELFRLCGQHLLEGAPWPLQEAAALCWSAGEPIVDTTGRGATQSCSGCAQWPGLTAGRDPLPPAATCPALWVVGPQLAGGGACRRLSSPESPMLYIRLMTKPLPWLLHVT